MIAFFHGEYGWPGFAAAALFAFALVFLFNELAKASLKKLKLNRRSHKKRARKTHRV
jgi:hypothetical protein